MTESVTTGADSSTSSRWTLTVWPFSTASLNSSAKYNFRLVADPWPRSTAWSWPWCAICIWPTYAVASDSRVKVLVELIVVALQTLHNPLKSWSAFKVIPTIPRRRVDEIPRQQNAKTLLCRSRCERRDWPTICLNSAEQRFLDIAAKRSADFRGSVTITT